MFLEDNYKNSLWSDNNENCNLVKIKSSNSSSLIKLSENYLNKVWFLYVIFKVSLEIIKIDNGRA